MYKFNEEEYENKEWYWDDPLCNLVGKTIKEINVSDEYISFVTNEGVLYYHITAGCCSDTYFHDFIGVKHLLQGNPVLSTEVIPLEDITDEYNKSLVPPLVEDEYDERKEECLKHYGYRIVVDSEFGEVSAVLSFRNSSNGYYGGDIKEVEEGEIGQSITEDWFNY